MGPGEERSEKRMTTWSSNSNSFGNNNWGVSPCNSFGRDWGISPSTSFVANGRPDVKVTNDQVEFAVTIETGDDFRPEDLKVTTHEAHGSDVLEVEGRHVQDDGGSHVSRQFSRSYTLPPECKVMQMTSSLANGKLSVRVPKSRPQPQLQHGHQAVTFPSKREVPILVNGGGGDAHALAWKKEPPSAVGEGREVPIVHREGRASEEVPSASNVVREVKIDRTSGDDGFPWRMPPFPQQPSFSWMEPVQLFNQEQLFENVMDGSGLSGSIHRQPQGTIETSERDSNFEFTVDIEGYEPSELKVTVLDDVLKIEGKHASDVEERGCRKSTSRQFVRSYVLPRSVYRMDRVESSLTKAGKLVVTVPKVQPVRNGTAGSEVNIPIKMAQ